MPEEEQPTPATPTVSFFSPIAIIMLLIAGILDGIGLILFILSFFGIGIPLSFIPDIAGLVFLGPLMYLSAGEITVTRGAQKVIKKPVGKVLKRLGLSFLGESIPFFGDIAFCWTLAVYLHLKKG